MKVSEAIDLLRLQFLERGSSATTWRTDYQKVIKWLSPEATVTTSLLVDLVQRTPRNSKSRTRFLMVSSQLAHIAGVPWNPQPLKPQRGKRKAKRRDLPTDAEILEFWKSIENPGWAWVVGVMATYGLRNHEAFRCQFIEGTDELEVLEGKTGDRVAFPLYPEWVARFNLHQVCLPERVDLDRENERLGHTVTEYFSRVRAPFNPYDLRHCWAVRAHLRFNLSTRVAAFSMGHSEQVHLNIYRKWITMAQARAEIARATAAHPKPPL